jgi:hypothetical protein
MINLSFEECERFWYGVGMPLMATPDDMDMIQRGRELEDFDLAEVPARLEQAVTGASERDAYREALETIAANFPTLCDLIDRFLLTPEAVNFDLELDTILDQPE